MCGLKLVVSSLGHGVAEKILLFSVSKTPLLTNERLIFCYKCLFASWGCILYQRFHWALLSLALLALWGCQSSSPTLLNLSGFPILFTPRVGPQSVPCSTSDAAVMHSDCGSALQVFSDASKTHQLQPPLQAMDSRQTMRFERLSLSEGGAMQVAAVADLPEPIKPLAPQDLVFFVMDAGQYGVPLQPLEHLDDAALLLLRVLLEPSSSVANPLLVGLSQGVRINALVTMAELGRDEVQTFVRDYLLRQSGSANATLRRYGLWALGRGQLRHPTEATRLFLQQASQANFWCKDQGKGLGDCQALAEAAQDAVRSFSVARP